MTDDEVKAVAEAMKGKFPPTASVVLEAAARAAISKLDEMRNDWKPMETAPRSGIFQVQRTAPLFLHDEEVGVETDVVVAFWDSFEQRVKTPSMFSAVGERFLSWKPLAPPPAEQQ